MQNKIDELLKVLDMPERELDENRGIHQPQYEWLYEHAQEYGFIMKIPHPDCTFSGEKTQMFLADLAFRLRDEVVTPNPNQDGTWDVAAWRTGLAKVFEKRPHPEEDTIEEWFVDLAKPICWIIAALIAKELAKENTDVKDR